MSYNTGQTYKLNTLMHMFNENVILNFTLHIIGKFNITIEALYYTICARYLVSRKQKERWQGDN